MTHRERFAAVLNGELADRIPVVCRLNIWHRAHQKANDIPEIMGKNLERIQLDLGMGVSARNARVTRSSFKEPITFQEWRNGNFLYQKYTAPLGSLLRVSEYDPVGEQWGISPAIIEFPIKTIDDYKIYEQIVSSIKYEPNYEDYYTYDQSIGENGFPMVIFGVNPAHDLILRWVGYENAYLHIFDSPEVFGHAVEIADEANRRMWPIAAASPAKLVMFGANFDSAITPPSIVRKYFMRSLKGFCDEMHNAGKKVAAHMDGDMGLLLDSMLECNIDVADCFACAPMTSLLFRDAIRKFRGRILIWGGMPSPMLEAGTTNSQFEEHLDMLRRETEGIPYIAGIADQAMPPAEYHRLRRFSAQFAKFGS